MAETLKMPDELTKWQGRIQLARRFQDKHGNTGGRWDENVKATAGDFDSVNELGEEAIDVNMIRSTMKTALPPLWLNEPHVSIRPTVSRYEDRDNVRMAEVTEIEVNYWLRELKVRQQVKKAVIEAESTNLGYVYVGYTKNKADIETEGMVTENNPVVRHKQPFVRHMPTKNVLVPPGYDELEDMPWVDLVFCKPKTHVVQRYGLTEEQAEDLPTSDYKKDGIEQGATAMFNEYLDSDDAKNVEIHNVWDKETKKVYVVVEGYDAFLEEPKAWPFEVEGFPLVLYRPEEISGEYHGTPPNTYVMPQNKELNATRTAMRKRRNRTKSVVWADSSIDQTALEKYTQADDGEVISADFSGEPIKNKLMLDTGLPFDTGDLAYDNVIKRDLIEQSGLSAEQRGAGDPSVDSATASANIEKGTQVRGADRGDGVKMLYLGISRKLVMILRQFPDQKRSRLIAGPIAGQFTQVDYTLQELKGEFQFELDFSAMLADNPATRATQAVLKYNLMRGDPLVNPERLILDVLSTQNVVDPESYLLNLKSPDEEIALMMQGLPVQAHERDQHEQHLAMHDQQGEQLDQQIARLDATGQQDSSQRLKLAFAQTLLTAHAQDHIRIVQQIVGQQGGAAGKPVAENLLRNQVRVNEGGETQAELSGQPLTAPGMIQ